VNFEDVEGTVGLCAHTCEEFLAALGPMASHWVADDGSLAAPGGWLFRGQRDAKWDLVPSAFRNESFRKAFNKHQQSAVDALSELARYQRRVLSCLMHEVDMQGLPIPLDGEEYRSSGSPEEDVFDSMGGDLNRLTPGEAARLALAQHYGIPTTLLDWSRRPLIAAYFAAKDAAANPVAERPAVWAVRETALHIDNSPRFWVVTAPTTSNPNLGAQHGVFTLQLFHFTSGYKLNESLLALMKSLSDRGLPNDQVPWFVRATLPTAEAPRLLRVLAYSGVHAGTLFPGHAGAVEALRERILWDVVPDLTQRQVTAQLHAMQK
jgi:FRG domain